jgi:hypothetical protein
VNVARAAQELFAEVLPCAGQQAVATTGWYWPLQDAFQGIHRQEIVPVRYQRRIYEIPERFVTPAQESVAPHETKGQRAAPRCGYGPEGGRSEVARLLHIIQREYEAAEQGLTGLAQGTATHRFIDARMERVHQGHTQLQELVGPGEATVLIAHAVWSTEEIGQGAV